MSQPISLNPVAPRQLAIGTSHQRSLSGQAVVNPSTATSTISTSLNSSHRGRRPVGGVAATTVQKRRFRTQSSTVGQRPRQVSSTAMCGGDAHQWGGHDTRTAKEVIEASASEPIAVPSRQSRVATTPKESSTAEGGARHAGIKPVSAPDSTVALPKIATAVSAPTASRVQRTSATADPTHKSTATTRAVASTTPTAATSSTASDKTDRRDFSASAPAPTATFSPSQCLSKTQSKDSLAPSVAETHSHSTNTNNNNSTSDVVPTSAPVASALPVKPSINTPTTPIAIQVPAGGATRVANTSARDTALPDMHTPLGGRTFAKGNATADVAAAAAGEKDESSGNKNSINARVKEPSTLPQKLLPLTPRHSASAVSPPPQPPSPAPAKPAESSTAAAVTPLGPLRGSTHVSGGNSSTASKPNTTHSVAAAGDGKTFNAVNTDTTSVGVDKAVASDAAAAAPLSRQPSATAAALPRRSSQLTLSGEHPPASLPHVSPQLPAHRTTSQLSATAAAHATPRASGTPMVKSSVESVASAAADGPRGTTPSTPSLTPTNATKAARLQPHPPATQPPLQQSPQQRSGASSASPVFSATAVHQPSTPQVSRPSPSSTSPTEWENAAVPLSRHASQYTAASASKANHKAGPKLLPPPIHRLFTSPISLRNFGATCYLNSIVQCLLNTPWLLRALDADRQRIIKEWEEKKSGGAFDEAHRRSCAERHAPATSALLDLGTSRPSCLTPVPQLLLSLKAACAECNDEFAGNGQNDAHEFLITLLGVINEEVCRSKPETYETMKDVEDESKLDAYTRWAARLRQENNSAVYDFFGGVAGSTVQCATCALVSYRFEALLDVSLPMAYNSGPQAVARASGNGDNTLKKSKGKARPDEVVAVDLLLADTYFSDQGEYLSGPMQVTCDRCKRLCDKTIWSTIEQWPPILVLHLKRFNNAGVKNEAAVVFPYTFCPFGRVKYQLYAVCCHRGTASSGHYTSYVYAEDEDEEAAPTDASVCSPKTNGGSGEYKKDVDGVTTTPVTSNGRFHGPTTGAFAPSADNNSEVSEKNDLPHGWNMTQMKPKDSVSGSHGVGSGKGNGKWYLCNDESITAVTASEVVSKTQAAYILFYCRVREPQACR